MLRRRSIPILLLPALVALAACHASAPPPSPASAAAPPATATAIAIAAAPTPLVLGPIDPTWDAPAGAAGAQPAPDAPPRTVIELRVAPASRLIADANLLGRKLPMRLGDLIVDALAKNTADMAYPITADLLAMLAPDRTFAFVLAQRKGVKSRELVCAALPFARPADAAAVGDRIGPVLSDRGGASERRCASGMRLWTGIQDGALLLSDSYDGLVATCAQALAATRAPLPAEDAVVTTNVQSNLAMAGLDSEDAVAKQLGDALAAAADASAKAAGKSKNKQAPTQPLSREAMRHLGQEMGRAAAQMARARLGLTATAADGLVLSFAIEPRPDTNLARRTAASVPYAIDPALPVASDRTMVAAWGALGLLEPVVRLLVQSAGDATFGRALDKKTPAAIVDEFLAIYTGGGSCALDIDGALASACSWPLRPGADPRKALPAYAALMRAMAGLNASMAGRRFSPRIKNDVLEFEWAIDVSAMTPEQAAMLRGYAGGEVTRYALAVRGARVVQFQGQNPRARLLAWKDVAPGAAAPARPPLLADELARRQGASFVLWLDPLALAMKMLTYARDPGTQQARIMLSALPGLAATRTPLVLDAPGGSRLTGELRIPMVTFDNVASLIGPFMGLMGH